MARNERGQFMPGTSGNPYGRPRKVEPDMFEDTDRDAFFEIDNEEIAVNVGGRPVKMTMRKAIDRQMALKAASGDSRAAVEWSKRRDRHLKKYAEETAETIEHLAERTRRIKDYPEDVTDEYLNDTKIWLEKLHPRLKWLFNGSH